MALNPGGVTMEFADFISRDWKQVSVALLGAIVEAAEGRTILVPISACASSLEDHSTVVMISEKQGYIELKICSREEAEAEHARVSKEMTEKIGQHAVQSPGNA
jgi:hypothetical protein